MNLVFKVEQQFLIKRQHLLDSAKTAANMAFKSQYSVL